MLHVVFCLSWRLVCVALTLMFLMDVLRFLFSLPPPPQVHSLLDVESQAAGDAKPRDRQKGGKAAKGAGGGAAEGDGKAAEGSSR